MLVQDITVTIDLDDISKSEYQELIKTLNRISCGPIRTDTYDPEDPVRPFTSEEREKLKIVLDIRPVM